MQYGQHARTLVEELKRSQHSSDLPPYNDVAVKGALQDFQLHLQALENQSEPYKGNDKQKTPKSLQPSIVLQHAACLRNKRGLVIYHRTRLQRIRDLYYWTSGNDGRSATQQHLSPSEASFLQKYSELVAEYTDEAIPEVSDLRSHCSVLPVTTDRVLCRVVQDAPFAGGPVVLESGQSVMLTLGSTHYLLYTDVEEYLRSGALRKLTTEEEAGKN